MRFTHRLDIKGDSISLVDLRHGVADEIQPQFGPEETRSILLGVEGRGTFSICGADPDERALIEEPSEIQKATDAFVAALRKEFVGVPYDPDEDLLGAE